MKIESVNAKDHEISLTENADNLYRLHNWLPLNSENYKEYQAIDGMAQRIIFMEEKLTGNLLSFFTEIGFRAEQQIDLHITDVTIHMQQVEHEISHFFIVLDIVQLLGAVVVILQRVLTQQVEETAEISL